MKLIRDRQYLAYYLFTSFLLASMLAVEDVFEDGKVNYLDIFLEFLLDIPLITGITLIISLISYPVVQFLNKHLPWESANWKRFVLEMTIVVVMVVLFTAISRPLFEVYVPEEDNDTGYEVLDMIMFFFTFFMVFSFHEFMTLSGDKAALARKSKLLEEQNDTIKYEALKSQINPHFLFNSLNVLSSLIYTDTEKSDQFIKKFSEVFRYVIELNQESVVEIKKELKFLESYLFLQKIRYGSNLTCDIQLDSEFLNKFVPPLTLQLVVENAIKHNEISDEKKLDIFITNGKEDLIVSNSFQSRGNLNYSTGIGQQNLVQKYKLMYTRLPRFYVQDELYVVKLPAMNNKEWKKYSL